VEAIDVLCSDLNQRTAANTVQTVQEW